MTTVSKQVLVNSGGLWRIADTTNEHPQLPVGVYTLGIDMGGLFLSESDQFTMPKKVYGDIDTRADRILQTFKERPYITGVLLEGEKGSGKTLLAKQISILGLAAGFPTILVNTAFHGATFNTFMQQLHQPCILLFDEFEKVYEERDDQQDLLTFFDGTVPTKKLCILTVNQSYGLDTNLVNRPGRLFYSLSFDKLDEKFIREYVLDRLDNKAYTEGVIQAATTFARFNFDQLQALVEEMNRYDEPPMQALRWLNIRPTFENDRRYIAKLYNPKNKLVKIHGRAEYTGNPLDPDNSPIAFQFSVKKSAAEPRGVRYQQFEPGNFVKVEREEFLFINDEKYSLILSPKPEKKYDFGYTSMSFDQMVSDD